MLRIPATLLVLVIAACSGGGATAPSGMLIVATTTIVGDLVENVAGDAAAVEVLMPVGVGPHDFQASARQSALLEEADLVVAVGFGLEEGLADVVAAMEDAGRPVFHVAERTERLLVREGGAPDPHVWMDPTLMAAAAVDLGAELESIAPGGGWPERAAGYAAALDAADSEIEAILDVIPEERRVLVTGHDSLGYFADRYRLDVVGVIVPGGSTLAEPSSADLAGLVKAMEQRGVPAVFSESTEPDALAVAVAAEAGGAVAVIELFVGSLGGPGSGAETLIDMLRTDARLIVEGLG